MRLAVVTNILTPYRIPLFEALAARVSEFTVWLMATREENRQWQLGTPRFHVEVLPGMHVRPRGRMVSLHVNYGMWRALRRWNPDVVLSGGFGPANVAALAYCEWFHKPFVAWGEVTLRDEAAASKMRRLVRRAMLRRAAGALASSSEAREAFLHYGADPGRTVVSLLPIDAAGIQQAVQAHRDTDAYRLARARYRGRVLLSIGRLTAVKGYNELFTIYRRLLAEQPDITLLIVGDGPERASYERYVREQGWTNVHFVGFVQAESLPQWLALADVFVFHTLFDPFGVVLTEAMAAGVPVVSSIHAAATHDLVEEGVTGFRIDPRQALASANTILRALALTPQERSSLTQAAWIRARECDIVPAADDIVRFLESLMTAGEGERRPSAVSPSMQKAGR